MSGVKNQVRKILSWDYFPYIIMFLFIFVIHLVVKLDTGDDVFFSKALNNRTMFSWIKERYLIWSSRVFIETIMVTFVELPYIVWKVLDTLIMTLGAVAVSKIFVNKNQRSLHWIIVFLFIMFPFTHMGSAGWIATTTNYMIPLSLGFIALHPIKKVIYQETINWYEYILYTLVALVAANQEQMAIILWSTYFGAILYLLYQKKIDIFLSYMFILCSGSILTILTCPGNAIRSVIEIGHSFPEYGMFTFVEKIELGFSTMMYQFVMTRNLIFITFCFLLCYGIFIKYKDPFFRIISLVPLVLSLVLGLFGSIFSRIFPFINNIILSSQNQYGVIDIHNFDAIKSYIPILIMTFVFCIIILSLYLLFGNTKNSAISIFIFIIGATSRMLMGFSPTIFASGTRTSIFMYFAFVLISIMIIKGLPDENTIKTRKALLPTIALMSIMSYIYFLIQIILN